MAVLTTPYWPSYDFLPVSPFGPQPVKRTPYLGNMIGSYMGIDFRRFATLMPKQGLNVA